MKSLQVKKQFNFRIKEREIPPVGTNEVLVKVLACGVCGSDVHMMQKAEDFASLGHEIAAQVVEVGGGVTRFSPKDTVIVEDVTLCGVCRECKNGDTHLCQNGYTLNGQSGMGDYMVLRENSLVKYDGLDAVTAALTEPLAVSISTYLAAQLPLNGTLVVYGLGVLALMCVRLAKHFGAYRVVCVGSGKNTKRNKHRASIAKQLGAHQVLFSDDDIEAGILETFGGKKADGVIVTSPPHTMPQAINAAKYGANVVTIGLDMGGNGTAPIDIDALIMNKNTIVPVFAEPAKYFPLSLELLHAGVIDAKLLVTHTFGLQDTGRLAELFQKDNAVIKAVMTDEGVGAEWLDG